VSPGNEEEQENIANEQVEQQNITKDGRGIGEQQHI